MLSGRSAAWLARLVRDQEAGGSNPLAPTTLFRSTIYIKRERLEYAKSSSSETKRSCLMSVGRKRSLFIEFISLQRKVHFTDHPVFEKAGTGSGFSKKNQKARFKSCVLPRCHSATAFIASNPARQDLSLPFRASEGHFCRGRRAANSLWT
jgi:hypothetical protein